MALTLGLFLNSYSGRSPDGPANHFEVAPALIGPRNPLLTGPADARFTVSPYDCDGRIYIGGTVPGRLSHALDPSAGQERAEVPVWTTIRKHGCICAGLLIGFRLKVP